MRTLSFELGFALAAAAVSVLTTIAWGSEAALLAKADSLYAAEQFTGAAAIYEEIVRAEPSNGRAWFRLGMCRHSNGEHAGAIEPLRRSAGIGGNPSVMYNLACAFARLNQADSTFAWLDRAAAAGFQRPDQLRSDPDLDSIRSDPRFTTVVEAAERGARPCEHQTEYRQFDFWLGDWNVYNPTGQLAATSRIENLVAGCVILENYQQTDGYLGKSMSFYDAGLSKWRQIWVDRQGKVLDFTGRFEDGAMRFEGENRDAPSGAPRFRRMTLSAKGPDEVLQQGESSLDAVSWSLDYELTYKRQSP